MFIFKEVERGIVFLFVVCLFYNILPSLRPSDTSRDNRCYNGLDPLRIRVVKLVKGVTWMENLLMANTISLLRACSGAARTSLWVALSRIASTAVATNIFWIGYERRGREKRRQQRNASNTAEGEAKREAKSCVGDWQFLFFFVFSDSCHSDAALVSWRNQH